MNFHAFDSNCRLIAVLTSEKVERISPEQNFSVLCAHENSIDIFLDENAGDVFI